MKRVVHLGPSESKGGMATVIENLVNNTPDGWVAEVICTHSENTLAMVGIWRKGLRELSKGLRESRYDVVHIHVTHSISWWRKLSFINLCEKFGVPMVVHIHSGKFDIFCSGFAGRSVKKVLSKKNLLTVVLEERWKRKLIDWIPTESEVIRNFSYPIPRSKKSPGRKLKLLVLSRNSPIKRHAFAIDIAECINNMGREASISITGVGTRMDDYSRGFEIRYCGWVSEHERRTLISESDFLLSPSRYEGSSMSVIESMVSGLPCLVSSASRETIGVNEMIIEEDDPKLWAKRILEISNEPIYSKTSNMMAERAMIYSPTENKERISEIYENLVGSHDGN